MINQLKHSLIALSTSSFILFTPPSNAQDITRVEAENYDAAYDTTSGNAGSASNCVYRGLNVDVGNTGDTNGSCAVGWIAAGEYLEYTLNLEGGDYQLTSRVASDLSQGSYEVYLDGQLIASDSVPDTGGWGVWETHNLGEFNIGPGEKTLRIEMTGSYFNLNWLEFERLSPPADQDGDGVPDNIDQCPDTSEGFTVDANGCPIDSDGDGVPDDIDACASTPSGASVDELGCGIDSDDDGIFDGLDLCPNTPTNEPVDDVGCPIDSDNDGVTDGADQCPATPSGASVNAQGCPLDSDEDGVYDGLDLCPNTPNFEPVDAGGCPLDSDGDGVSDGLDQCPATLVGAVVDSSGCALDSDNDGISDGLDQCPGTLDGEIVDALGCALDSDNDGVSDANDACPNTPSGALVDSAGCPIDSDNDGVFDGLDLCEATPTGASVDSGGCPIDSDADGVFDGLDSCANTPGGAFVDAEGCPSDSDQDGVWDGIDQCAQTATGTTVDSTGCAADTDNDGVIDDLDLCPSTQAGSAVDSDGCATDSDGDGIDDDLDLCPGTPDGVLVGADGCAVITLFRLEAEDYIAASDSTTGNESSSVSACTYNGLNVDVEDTGDEDGTCNVGWTEAGESLTYNLDIPPGTYKLSARVASDLNQGAYELYINGQLAADDTVTDTGGWQVYETHTLGEVEITSSPAELVVEITGSYLNLNWLEFELVAPPADSDNDGIPDSSDNCPGTPNNAVVDAQGCPIDSDGDGVSDNLDQCIETPIGALVDADGCPLDSDNDGVFDGIDQCPATPAIEPVDDSGCPMDSDNDGVSDGLDQCSDTPTGAEVSPEGCPMDTDGDGVFNGLDQCPATPTGALVGSDGCAIDSDADGVADGLDLCANTPMGATVDSQGCPLDSDSDGVFDGLDLCPSTPSGEPVGADGCPLDSDNDGISDGTDQCPDTPTGAAVDTLGCPSDSDGDGVYDGIDQCADTPAGASVDAAGCPSDSDGDGVFDGLDVCANTPTGATIDATGCPLDSDQDGVFDGIDQCPSTPSNAEVDASGCPLDSDNDGIFDGIDQCPGTPAGATIDSNGCPLDSDGDGVYNGLDQCADTATGTTVDATGCPADSDNDGVIDDLDLCPNTATGLEVDQDGCAIDSDGDGVNNDEDLCPETPLGTTVDANGCALVTQFRLEAEDYIAATDTTTGNESSGVTACVYNGLNVDVEDTGDEDGTCNVGWTEAGESLSYEIDLPAGTYLLSARVASDLSQGEFDIYLDDVLVTSDAVGNTGGWQVYETHDLGEVAILAGIHTLRVEITGSYLNLNWIDFDLLSPILDSDGDGVPDSDDLCPATPSGTAVDVNGCALPPADTDGDGVEDSLDECPNTPQGTEVDANGCALPPPDSDGDGVPDGTDLCPNTAAGAEVDADGCTLQPSDSDGDGVADTFDLCPGTPVGVAVDNSGCPFGDSDNDGVNDNLDQCPNTPEGTAVNSNGCPLGTVPPWTGAPPPDSDFQTLPLATGVNLPMEMDISANGDLYVIGRMGEFYAYENGDLVAKSTIDTNAFEEGGLIGLALDPGFVSNRWVYLHYTDPNEPVHHVSRFTVNPDNTLDLASESILLSYGVQLQECCHVAGSMAFDGNGNLFISTGDNTSPYESDGYAAIDEQPGRGPFDAQKSSSNTNDLRGKILRITPTPDGSYTIPAGNLFTQDALHRGEIFTMGHRNPFRIALDPATNELFWGEVGPDANMSDPNRGPAGYDEINRTFAAGNFGWPYFSGENEAYNDYNFANGQVGAKFDPINVFNDSPNNTGASDLPDAQPAWITLSHRATMIAGIYRWDDSISDAFKLPSYFHGRLIYWNFNNDQVFEVDAENNSTASRQWLNTSLVDGIIDAKISPQNNRLYMIAYGGNCCDSPPFAGILMEVRYTGSGPEIVTPSSYYAVNFGGDAYSGADGTQYEAHGYTFAGQDAVTTDPISGTEDDTLYQAQRWYNGDINLEFPVEDGTYNIQLKLAEHYWSDIGDRVFDIDIEGQRVADDIDMVAEVGANTVYDLFFNATVSDGVLDVDLIQDIENPSVAGIIIRKQGEFPATSTISLLASNGNYVSTAGGLQAGAATVSNQEIFEIVDAGAGKFGLYSVSANAYLSAPASGLGAVSLNSASLGATETFDLLKNADGSYSLRYAGTGTYLSAGEGTSLSLVTAITDDEKFTLKLADVCDPTPGYGIDCRPHTLAFLNMPAEPAGDFSNVPTLLSQTGAFADTANLAPSSSLMPYEPIAKLWSDRAQKQRWVAIPSGQKVHFEEQGKWTWPAGTVFVKHFELPTDETNPNQLRRLETRILVVKEDASVYGVTYKWLPDESDAELQTTILDEDFTITADGGDWLQTWTYPGAGECLICHNPESTGVLGLKTASLNWTFDYPSGVSSNQIATWNQLSIFDEPLDEGTLDTLPAHVNLSDTSASNAQRLRSYWDINCGFCHGTLGIAALWDGRFETPLAEQGIILGPLANQRDYFADYGLSNPFVIDPANPDNSIMFIRDASIDDYDRMPPLGRNLIDEEYIELLLEWINGL